MKIVTVNKSEGVFTIDEMCELFGLLPYDSWDSNGNHRDGYVDDGVELNIQDRAFWEYAFKKDYEYDGVFMKSQQGDEVDIETIYADELYDEVWAKIATQLYERWKNATEETLSRYCQKHGIRLVKVKVWHSYQADGETKRFREDGFRAVPEKSWKDVAQHIADTISGYGYFHFPTAESLKSSYPYNSYKTASIEHFHWMKYWPDVYGDSSIQRVFENNLDSYLRNW